MVGRAARHGKPGEDGPAQGDQANRYHSGNQHYLYLDRHGLPACFAAFR
jgi:hypothetical protein